MRSAALADPSAFSLVSGLWTANCEPAKPALVLRSTNFAGDGLLDFSDVARLSVDSKLFATRRLLPGDIIVERSGGSSGQPVGRVAYFVPPDDNVYFTSNFTTALRVVDRERFDPSFVALYLHALYLAGETEHLQRSPTGIRNLDWQEYLRFKIPELPLAEQVAVANVAGGARSAELKEAELLEALADLRSASVSHLFTAGLKGGRQQETPLGPMPEDWEPRTIISLCEIWSGGTPRKAVAEYWNGDIPWVSAKDLKSPTLEDSIDHVTPAGVEAGGRLAPADSVLLLVRGMGLAKDLPVAVITRPMAFNQDLKALVSRGEYSGAFVRAAINVNKQRLLNRIVPSAHGTMTLNLNDIETFEVTCPRDPDEANEIAAILIAIDGKIAVHQKRRAAFGELFRAILHKLVSGAMPAPDPTANGASFLGEPA